MKNIKSALVKELEEYKNHMANLNKEIELINNNYKLSSVGKNEQLEDKRIRYKELNNFYRIKINQLLDQAAAWHKKKLQDRMNDDNYQLKLRNALDTLTLTARTLDNNEIYGIIEPFLEDEVSKKALYAAIRSVKPDYYSEELSKTGEVSKTLEIIEQLKNNINTMTYSQKEWSGLSGLETEVSGLIEAFNKFDDRMIWQRL